MSQLSFASPSDSSRRSWWGLPASIGIQGLIIAIALVIPLLAHTPPELYQPTRLLFAVPLLAQPAPPASESTKPVSTTSPTKSNTRTGLTPIPDLRKVLESEPIIDDWDDFDCPECANTPPCPGCEALMSEGVPGGPAWGNASPQPTRREARPQPVRPGGAIAYPKKVVHVAPIYPLVALEARITGSVILETIIDRDGSVKDVRVLRSVPLLDEAAIRAVSQWRYEPTTLNGLRIPILMTVTLRFEL